MSRHRVQSFFPVATSTPSRYDDIHDSTTDIGFKEWCLDQLFPHADTLRCPDIILNIIIPKNSSNSNSESLLFHYVPPVSMEIITNNDDVDIVATENNNNQLILFQIYYPILFIAAIIGIGIGIGGAIQLLRQRQRQQKYSTRKFSSLWIPAFLCYGLMNVSAIILHCFTPVVSSSSSSSSTTNNMSMPSTKYSDLIPWIWMCDNYMTGSSSIALALSSTEDIININTNTNIRLKSLPLSTWFQLFYSIIIIGIGIGYCCISFWNNRNNTLPMELWYILSTLIASSPINIRWFHIIIKGRQQQQQQQQTQTQTQNKETSSTTNTTTKNNGLIIFLIGSCMVIAGVLFDSKFCQLLYAVCSNENEDEQTCTSTRYHYSIIKFLLMDLCNAATFTFIGCNFAFVGIYLSIKFNEQEKNKI